MAAKTWGIKEAQTFLQNLNRNMRANVETALKENAVHMRNALIKKVTEGDRSWPALSPLTIAHKGSSKPLLDHGDYRMSMRAIPVKADGPTFARFFVGIPRATREPAKGISMMRIGMVHEFGARIRPKKAKMLTLPVSREADRLIRQYGSIRRIPGLFRPRGAGGRLKNVLCISEGGKLKTLFVMKKQVIVPPRPVFHSVIEQERAKFRLRVEAAARLALQGKVYRVQLA